MTKVTETLSSLPTEMLRNWVLTLSNCHIALSTFESGEVTRRSVEQMADLINLALEEKQAMILRGHDIQDAEFTFV